MMNPVEEIKARLPIEELVGGYVQLKKMGRHFKALCPFHKEKTPSFVVSPERQMAYCFGCRKGGDHFKFLMEVEGLDFRGALKMLAERTGVDLPKLAPIDVAKKSEKDRLIEMHEKATEYFADQLWNTDDGKKVLSYLKKRELTEETIKKFRLGFAGAGAGTGASRSERFSKSSEEGSGSLYKYLLEHGFTRSEIITGGLGTARDTTQGEGVADRFRMRLMFPIENLAGDVCAFGGRATSPDQEPKYLNSAETPIYKKNSLLYGLNVARGAIRDQKCAVIVEGYMDVITVVQAGFVNVVACSGTALTENQLRLLKRFTGEIILAFDLDNAGRIATERSIELALAGDFFVRVAVWDEDGKLKDPDECIKEDRGRFEESLKNARPATEYLFDFYKSQFGADTIGGKKKIIESLMPIVNRIISPVERDFWLKNCAQKLDITYQSLYDEVKRFSGKQRIMISSKKVEEESGAETKSLHAHEYLLGLLLTYPESRSMAFQLIRPEDFEDKELQNIYRSLNSEYNQTLDDCASERAEILRMYAETRHADMNWEAVLEEVKQVAHSLLKKRFDRDKRSLVSKLRDAEEKEKQNLLELYQDLLTREELLLRKING